MKLRQKIYELTSLSEDFNLKTEEGDLVLVVNGYTTDIKIGDLFVGNVKILKNGIKGFSILQNHKLESGFLVDGDDNRYSLWINGKNLLFDEILDPTFQSSDIKLSEVKENKYLDVLIDGIKQFMIQEKFTDEPTVTDVKPPEPEVSAKEIELEEIIEELEDQGYDHFGKGQYNIFLQHNVKPVLYIGKVKAGYISTDYDDGDRANLTFNYDGVAVIIGIEKDGLTFPVSTPETAINDTPTPDASVHNDTIDTNTTEDEPMPENESTQEGVRSISLVDETKTMTTAYQSIVKEEKEESSKETE